MYEFEWSNVDYIVNTVLQDEYNVSDRRNTIKYC